MSKKLLYAAFPNPPVHMRLSRVGHSPTDFLALIPPALIPPIHLASLAHRPEVLTAPLNRIEVRNICLDPLVTPEAKYACAMAWGGQHRRHFRTSIADHGLVPLINSLLTSVCSRIDDFAHTRLACAGIPGLGISFYTKLLFFLRPRQDAYILDQWTGKSINLIQHPHIVRLTRPSSKGDCQAMGNTTPDEYEGFCKALDGMPVLLWAGAIANGEDVEMAMFDQPKGFWRSFTKINFAHHVAGNLLHSGAESLTQAFDYRSGYLVIRQIHPARLFVIQIHGSCCHWSLDDSYRFLLARLRELLAQHGLPVTLVLPAGQCPAWFAIALNDLGIVTMDEEWNDQEEADAEEDEGEKEDESHQDPREETKSRNDKLRIYLKEKKGPQTYLRIVNQCTEDGNIGMICLRKHRENINHIWLRDFLIDEIAKAHGDFTAKPGYIPLNPGQQTCVGAHYTGGRGFATVGATVQYLKQYFDVKACEGNAIYNHAWINAL